MSNYQDVLDHAEKLPPEEQLRLLEQLASIVRRRMGPFPRRSILELRGLGKQCWQGVDAQRYVDRERASWNG
ncbi:MAG: hypothetical protein HY000_25380 [Planctomycetes bacterium]|nr:hypothetical protein [Planctomycetota bacterium]